MSDIQCCHQIKVLTGQIPGPMGDVTEEAKETLEATKEQAQIIENKKNEAVTQIDAYTEQSYLNAKSVNIRQFQNFENMKTSKNFTDDLLIATQGFFAAGDGGNAQYYTLPEDSDEEADGYSVIAVRERVSGSRVGSAKVGNARTTKYKNRKIGLLTPNVVDVRWFGAVLDGVTDDSDAFNRAVKYLVKKRKSFTFKDITNVASGTLYVPKGIMKINKAIEIDAGCMGAYFDGTIIDATEISTDYAVRLYSSTWSHLSSTSMHNLFGLILRGDNTKNKVAVLYDGVPQFNMVKSAISGFGKSIQFKNNCYIYNFYDCGFDRCSDVCIENPSGLVNSGERINFIGCTFANSTLAIRNANPNGSIHLLNCSIDYNAQAFDISNNSIIFCTDCHFEWAKYDKPHFVLNSSSCMLKIEGGYLVTRPDAEYGDEEVPKLSCAFDNQKCDCTGGVILDNVHIHAIITEYLFSGVNYQIKNSKTYNPFTLPPLCEQDIDYSVFTNCLDTFIQKNNNSTQIYIDGTTVAIKRIDYNTEAQFHFFKKINPNSSGFGNLVLEFIANSIIGGNINVSLNTAYEKNDGTIKTIKTLDYYNIKNLLNEAGVNNKVRHTHTWYIDDNLLLFGKNYNKNIYIYVDIILWGITTDTIFKFNKINFEQF